MSATCLDEVWISSQGVFVLSGLGGSSFWLCTSPDAKREGAARPSWILQVDHLTTNKHELRMPSPLLLGTVAHYPE